MNRKGLFLAIVVGCFTIGSYANADVEVNSYENNISYSLTGHTNPFTAGTITITDGIDTITILDRNLGATSNDITSADSYGEYFQWGNNDSTNFITSGENWTGNENIALWGGSVGDHIEELSNDNWKVNNALQRQGPCPEGFHVPSYGELLKIQDMMGNNTGGMRTQLLIPLAGNRNYDDGLPQNLNDAFWWSSSPYSEEKPWSWGLEFYDTGHYDFGSYYYFRSYYYSRSFGFSLRCVYNNYISYPITYNNDGTITITDGENSITMKDRNVGATGNDITSIDSYGLYYQRGGMTGFDYALTAQEAKNLGFDSNWTSDGWTKEQEVQLCGNGYHIPTKDEWDLVKTILQYNVSVLSSLRIPATKYRNENAEFPDTLTTTQLRTSLLDSDSAYSMGFGMGYSTQKINRAYAAPIRCFKDKEPVSYTGVTWNESDGTITITDGINSIVMKDKNVGATSTDTTSSDSYGYHYQRGGMTGFEHSQSSDDAINLSGFVINWDNYIKLGLKWTPNQEIELCGEGYHIPTKDEMQSVIDMFTGNGNNPIAFADAFKIPLAGGRSWVNAEIFNQNRAYLWLNNQSDGKYGYLAEINKYEDHVMSGPKVKVATNASNFGYNIRCFKNMETSIVVKENPSKTSYTEGDSLDMNGLIIEVLYEGGDTKEVPYIGNENLFSITPENGSTLSLGTTEVTITYRGQSTTLSVNANAKPTPTPSYSGGGGSRGRSVSKSEDTPKINEEVLEEVEENNTEENKEENNTNKSELELAYEFAYKNGITTMDSIEKAELDQPLTRIAMAKMLSQYAMNVLGKVPANKMALKFDDVTGELNEEYYGGSELAYQLNIMGLNIPDNKFRPFDLVTRAEFGTALSRLLYGLSDGEGLYYETHLSKLKDEGIITNDNPNLEEARGYIMLMLMRAANK